MPLRKRDIKPSIIANPELAELGPMATLLFIFMWTLADRDGRLEDRPGWIKAKLLPHAQYANEDIDVLLDGLTAKGFLRRYDGEYVVENITKKSGIPLDTQGPVKIIQIVTFARHQTRLHPEEPKSYFSPPPRATVSPSPKGRKKKISKSAVNEPVAVNGSATERVRVGGDDHALNLVSSREVFSTARSIDNNRPNARAKIRSVGPSEKPPRGKPPAKVVNDWWPHVPEKVAMVRETLHQLGEGVGLAPPDDRMLRRIMDVCGDATGPLIHQTVRQLFQSRRFQGMRSWGLVPEVLRPLFASNVRSG